MLKFNIFIGKTIEQAFVETKKFPDKRRKGMSKPNRCQGKARPEIE